MHNSPQVGQFVYHAEGMALVERVHKDKQKAEINFGDSSLLVSFDEVDRI